MSSKIPPSGSQPPSPPPSPQPSGETLVPNATAASGGMTMTEFMKQFTPEQRKKLDQIMNQNFANELSREKRYHEQQVEYRKEIDPESYK